MAETIKEFPIDNQQIQYGMACVMGVLGVIFTFRTQMIGEPTIFGIIDNPIASFHPKGTDFSAKEHTQLIKYIGALFLTNAVTFGWNEISCSMCTTAILAYIIEWQTWGKINLFMGVFWAIAFTIGLCGLCRAGVWKYYGQWAQKAFAAAMLVTCALSTYDIQKFGFEFGWWEVAPKNPSDAFVFTFRFLNCLVFFTNATTWFSNLRAKDTGANEGLVSIATGSMMLWFNCKHGRGWCTCNMVGCLGWALIGFGAIMQYNDGGVNMGELQALPPGAPEYESVSPSRSVSSSPPPAKKKRTKSASKK